jgi:hypothetical protein
LKYGVTVKEVEEKKKIAPSTMSWADVIEELGVEKKKTVET